MSNMNKDPNQLSPEEQLDLLLEKFLQDPNDELPTLTNNEEIPLVNDEQTISTFPEDVASSEEQLDVPPMSEIPAPQESTAVHPQDVSEAATPEDTLPESAPENVNMTENQSVDTDLFEQADPTFPTEEVSTEHNETQEQTVIPLPDDMQQEDGQITDTDMPAEASAQKTATEETSTPEPILAEPLAEPMEETIDPDEQAVGEAGLTCTGDSEFDQSSEQTQQEQVTDVPSPAETEQPQENASQPQEEPVATTASKEENHMSPEETTEKPEESEEPEEGIYEDPRPPKKRRPRNNKTYGFFGIPHLLASVIWLGIIVFIGVGLGKFVWNCAADVLALGRPNSQVVITVSEEDDLESIAEKLQTTGLIKYRSLFILYGQISGAEKTIRTGTFKLNTQFDYHALVGAMSSNQRRETTNVTIPEGYTCAQIFRLLESKGVSTVAKLEAASMSSQLGGYWFLEGVERDSANCLEGFLFPDTYTFYLDHDPVGVLQKFLNNFSNRFNERMRIKLDTLNMTLADMMRANGLSEEYIAAHQMTVRDVVIVASLIERETSSNPESYNIASVIYNRLTNPNQFPCLQIDAALIYYTGRSEITKEDLITDHPYNTYTRPGLTIAGPISNPGAYSLDAALDPAETEYHYYALNPSTGAHQFSKTLKEHEDFLASIGRNAPKEESEE